MNIDMDSIIIDINSTVSDSGKAIDALIEKLNSLRDALSGVGSASNGFKTLSKNISSGSSSVASLRSRQTNKTPMPSLSEQTSQLGVNLNSKDIVSSIKTVNSEFTKYKNELGQVVTVQKKMKDGMDQYKVSVKDTVKQTSAFEKFKNDIKSTVSNIAQFYFGLTRAWSIMGDLVETSSEYTEAVNLFYTEMGTKSKEAEKWVKRFSEALYLDPKDVMQYMGAFNSLIHGLGVGVDNSYKMSKNLTQLSYDLASYKNISFEQAYDKLSSGIAGQIKGLRQVGVALSQNTLQELANQMGIKTRVKEMDEASKAQLRYIQIMRSSTNWQGDLGKTMMSTENILKSARQQWTLMTRALGDLAAVIVRAVMPYFIAVTQLIKEAAISLAKFFGFDIDFSDRFKTDNMKSASTGLEKITNGVDNVGKSAKKAKNEINKMLAPFDDLNVVQTKVQNAGSGTGTGTGGGASIGDLDLPEYDALSKLTSEWSDKIANAKKQIKSIIPIVKVLLGVFASLWAVGKLASFINNIKTLKTLFSGTGKVLKVSAGTAGLVFGTVVASVLALKREVPKVVNALNNFLFKGKSVKDVVKTFDLLDLALMSFLRTVNSFSGGFFGKVVNVGIAFGTLTKKAIESEDVIKSLGKEVSEVSKTKLKPLVSEFENLEKQINALDFSNKVIKQSDIDNIKNNLSEVRETIINELDADKNSQLKNLKTIEKALGVSKANQLYAKTEAYYKGQKNIIIKNSNEIQKILQNASQQNRSLTGEEINEIKKLREEMYKTGVKAAIDYSDDYYSIMGQLKNNLVALSTEQASAYVKKAKETKDKTIKTAKEQYDSVVGEAYKMKQAGAITKEEYNNIVSAADKTYKETVDKANKQYDDIYNTTTKKLGSTGKYIDKETGNIKSNWQMAWDNVKNTASKAWDSIKKIFGGVAKFFGDKFSEAWEKVKDIFSHRGKVFSGIVDGIAATFKSIVNMLIDGINKIVARPFDKVNGLLNSIRSVEILGVKPFAGLWSKNPIPVPQIPKFEQGGYPEKASLFWANENGIPEMVGQIGNKTAVANNDQITTSITNALIDALSGMNFGGQGTTVVNIGNKKVYEGMGEYINSENERYGTSYIKI